MQLRYFAALHDIAGERSSTVVFPLPVNLLDHLGARTRSRNLEARSLTHYSSHS